MFPMLGTLLERTFHHQSRLPEVERRMVDRHARPKAASGADSNVCHRLVVTHFAMPAAGGAEAACGAASTDADRNQYNQKKRAPAAEQRARGDPHRLWLDKRYAKRMRQKTQKRRADLERRGSA